MTAGFAGLDTRVATPSLSAGRKTPAWSKPLSYAIIVGLVVSLWLPRLKGPIDLRYDAGVYYALGTSLAEGKGYRIGTEPGAPEGIQYPPLLPAIVAVHQIVLGTTRAEVVGPWLRWTYALMSVGYGIAVLTLARRFLSPGLALLAAGLCCAHASTFFYSDLLFTELPFALTCVAFVFVLGAQKLKWRPVSRESVALVLAAAAYLLRAAGLAVLIAWVGEALIRRQWRLALLRALLAAIPVATWQMHVARVQASAEYRQPAYEYQRASYQYYNVTYGENMSLIDPFRPELGRTTLQTVIGRVGANLTTLPLALGESVSEQNGFWRAAFRMEARKIDVPPTGRERALDAGAWLLAAFVLLGAWVLIRRNAWPFVLLTSASVALVCMTPWPTQTGRYLAPAIPFLTIAFVLGFQWVRGIAARVGFRRPLHWGATAVMLSVVALQLFTIAFVFRFQHRGQVRGGLATQGTPPARLFYYDAGWGDWERSVAWLAANAQPSDVVSTTSPHLLSLRTGLKAVLPPMEIDRAEARRLLDTVPVKWLLVDQLPFLDIMRVYAAPAVDEARTEWRIAQQVGQSVIYERVGRTPTTNEVVR